MHILYYDLNLSVRILFSLFLNNNTWNLCHNIIIGPSFECNFNFFCLVIASVTLMLPITNVCVGFIVTGQFRHLWIQIFVAIKWLLVIDDKGTYLCPKRKLSNNTLTTNMLGRLGLNIDHFCCLVAFVMNLECNYRFRHTILNKHSLSISLSTLFCGTFFYIIILVNINDPIIRVSTLWGHLIKEESYFSDNILPSPWNSY